MANDLVDIDHQLAFYGSYHANPINIAVHIVGVPALLWSGLVMGTMIPTGNLFPSAHYVINQYLAFDYSFSLIWAAGCLAYYIILEPVGGILFAPQMVFTYLSAISFADRPNGIKIALAVHVGSWIAQILAHKFAEKRAPALKDNIIGALVLAPLFIHLEILFSLGYNHGLHQRMKRNVGVEIAKFRREQAALKRKAA